MTGLAEGADQICADVALNLQSEGHVRVTAILAFPPEVFSLTIQDPQARQHFENLIEQSRLPNSAIDFFVAPALDDKRKLPAFSDRNAWEAIRLDPEQRRLRYQEVGVCLVLYGQAMIALWDGQTSGNPGGTAEVIKAWFDGVSEAVYPKALQNLETPERRLLYHVPTKRKTSAPAESGGEGPVREYFFFPGRSEFNAWQNFRTEASTAWKLCSKKFTVLNFFAASFGVLSALKEAAFDLFQNNCSGVPMGERHPRAVVAANKGNLEHLNHDLKGMDFAETLRKARDFDGLTLSPQIQKMVAVRRAVADIAMANSKLLIWVVLFVFFLIGVGAFLLHSYSHHIHLEGETLHWTKSFLGGGLSLIFLAWLVGHVLHLCHVEPAYLDRRSLSEALRVQMSWTVAGLEDSVPASYLKRQRSELAWIRAAVRALAIPYAEGAQEFHVLAPQDQLRRLEAVVKGWVGGQASYFDSEWRKQKARLFLFQNLGLLLAFGGWALGLALFIGGFPALGHAEEPTSLALISLAALLLAGGLSIAYAENRHISESAFTYDHMRHLFRNGQLRLTQKLTASEALSTADAKKEIHSILRELGHEALEENADWINLHRARPFEPPVH